MSGARDRRHRGIRTRLRRALMLVTSLTVAAAVFAWIGLSVAESRLERHQAQSLSDLAQITSLVGRSVSLAADSARISYLPTLAELEAVQVSFGQQMDEFATLASALPSPPSAELFDMSDVSSIVRLVHRLGATTQNLFAITAEAIGLRNDPRGDSDLAALKATSIEQRNSATMAMVDVSFAQLTNMIEGLSSLVEDAALQRGNELLGLMGSFKTALIAGALASLVAGLLVSAFLNREIVRSLVGATEAISRLAGGDSAAELPGRERPDEIGDLARAFKVFKANALERDGLVRQVERDAQIRLGILNGLDEGVALFEPGGALIASNPRFLDLGGLGPDAIEPDFSLDRLLANMGRGRGPNLETSFEHEFFDGRIVEFRRGAMPRGDTLVTLADLTERKHMERRLRQSQQMEALGQLTGGIAHDFNNLLAAVSSNLQLIHDQSETDSPTHKRVGRALGAVDSGTAMIQRLLLFARRQPLQPESVDLNQLIAELVDLIELSIGPAITLRTELTANLPPVTVDPGQMESAILNLVFNARDAITGEGTIVLSTSRVSGNVEVTVRDTGSGMPPDVLARAFDPFFTTKSFGAGSGLGLSTVFGFIRQSNGHVGMESEEAGAHRIAAVFRQKAVKTSKKARDARCRATFRGAGSCRRGRRYPSRNHDRYDAEPWLRGSPCILGCSSPARVEGRGF
jgi:signal transduction histidine kinase